MVKKVDTLIGVHNRCDASSVNTSLREALLCGLWLTAKSSVLPTPRSFPFVQELFACAVPKLPGGFNPREVVLYKQMELIRTETVEKDE